MVASKEKFKVSPSTYVPESLPLSPRNFLSKLMNDIYFFLFTDHSLKAKNLLLLRGHITPLLMPSRSFHKAEVQPVTMNIPHCDGLLSMKLRSNAILRVGPPKQLRAGITCMHLVAASVAGRQNCHPATRD